MALGQRRATGVIHHSDQGCPYTSIAFGLRYREAGVQPSMGSVGDCYDNAMAESFFATLECELLDRVRFRTQSEARIAIFDFIEGFYNPRRRHSAISRRSSSSVRRQPADILFEPGFARVDPLRGRASEQLQERNQRQSIMSARGRSQALRCPSKRGSSSSYLDFRLYPVDSSLRGTELAQLAAQSALDADVDVVSRQHCGCAVGLTEIAGDVLTDTRRGRRNRASGLSGAGGGGLAGLAEDR